jgi:hypothetical protein
MQRSGGSHVVSSISVDAEAVKPAMANDIATR